MKIIELTQGKVTVVDDDVYEWASKFKWHTQNCRGKIYAARAPARELGKQRKVLLHREILRVDTKVDHRDGDGLNNQRYNLRAATHQQNLQAYRKIKEGTTSKFRGVSLEKRSNKWFAQVYLNKKRVFAGRFNQEEAAARAYDIAAKKFFGAFAQLNFL